MLHDGDAADTQMLADAEQTNEGPEREDELAMLLNRAPRELLAFVPDILWQS